MSQLSALLSGSTPCRIELNFLKVVAIHKCYHLLAVENSTHELPMLLLFLLIMVWCKTKKFWFYWTRYSLSDTVDPLWQLFTSSVYSWWIQGKQSQLFSLNFYLKSFVLQLFKNYFSTSLLPIIPTVFETMAKPKATWQLFISTSADKFQSFKSLIK